MSGKSARRGFDVRAEYRPLNKQWPAFLRMPAVASTDLFFIGKTAKTEEDSREAALSLCFSDEVNSTNVQVRLRIYFFHGLLMNINSSYFGRTIWGVRQPARKASWVRRSASKKFNRLNFLRDRFSREARRRAFLREIDRLFCRPKQSDLIILKEKSAISHLSNGKPMFPPDENRR